jgi:hypothetical protein
MRQQNPEPEQDQDHPPDNLHPFAEFLAQFVPQPQAQPGDQTSDDSDDPRRNPDGRANDLMLSRS